MCDFIKTTGVILKCDKHGDYEQRVLYIGPKPLVSDKCPDCASELKEAERNREEERIKRENESKYKKRKDEAGISPRNYNARFKNFDCSTKAKQDVHDLVKAYAKSIYDGEQESSLILLGKVGTGKTMLANCVANSLVASHSVRIIKLVDMVREIKNTWQRGTEASEIDVINHYTQLDLLIIDEAGIGFNSDTEKMLIFDIIDGRYQNMKPTMIISNLDMDELTSAIGERVIDRLRDGGGQKLVLNWESYRK